jgi:hypothetical protein
MSSNYSHDPKVVAQFAECLALSPSKLMEQIDSGAKRPEKVKEEVLVMLAREYRRRGKQALAWKIMLAICDRVRLSILRAVDLWRLSPIIREEFIEATIANLYDVVLGSDSPDIFWEIKFWVCFERRVLSSLRKHRLNDDRYVAVTDAEYVEKSTDVYTGKSLHPFDPEHRAIIAEGLAQLPEQLRTAFMLKHWAGFPEYSINGDEPATIAAVMGVSDRTVRNYLARAELLLNSWRQEQTLSSTA